MKTRTYRIVLNGPGGELVSERVDVPEGEENEHTLQDAVHKFVLENWVLPDHGDSVHVIEVN